MRHVPALVLGLCATGCAGSRIAELEAEQTELRAEYDDLQANVESLKREMIAVGMITEAQANKRVTPAKKGKAKKGRAKAPGTPARPPAGHPAPVEELSAQMPWTIARTGELPALPELPPPERTASPCGWSFKVESLAEISDFPLNRDGFGKSAPILLYQDDQPMPAHAMPAQFRETCSGTYRHAGFTFLFSPTGAVDDGSQRSYRIGAAPEFPLARGDDARPMYWVYPGTEVVLSFERGWDPAWGAAELSVAGRAAYGTSPARLTGPDLDETVSPGDFSLALPVAVTGPFEVAIHSPEDGPWLLIDTLTLGNADKAVVVTAEDAGL